MNYPPPGGQRVPRTETWKRWRGAAKNSILSQNRRHLSTALVKNCHLCSDLLLAPAPHSKQFGPPLLANIPAIPACDSPGPGQAEPLEKRGGRHSRAGGSPKKLAGSHRTPSSTRRNAALGRSQDKEYQGLLAPGSAPSLPTSVFMTTLSSPHLTPKCLQLKTFLIAQETGFVYCWCLMNQCMINLLTDLSSFSFSSRQLG